MQKDSSMQKDYYEPLEPHPVNEGGQVPAGATGMHSRETEGGGGRSMSEQAGDVATKTQEKAQEMGSKMQEQADAGLDKAASGLQKAAEQMRERGGSEGLQGQVATKAADTMEKTAGYLRDHDTDEIWQDVESFVKEHPMQAAAGALVAGFVLGRLLR